MLARYGLLDEDTLPYFTTRLTQAPRDVDFALDDVKRHATTPELRGTICRELPFRTDVLWSQPDAPCLACVTPRIPPPGAFVPGSEESA